MRFAIAAASLPCVSDPIDPRKAAEDVEWCRTMFESLAEGGVWGIPRSGVIFRKEGEALVLHATMPWMPAMLGRLTPEQLKAQQEGEFQAVKHYFEAAGIPVRRQDETTEGEAT